VALGSVAARSRGMRLFVRPLEFH